MKSNISQFIFTSFSTRMRNCKIHFRINITNITEQSKQLESFTWSFTWCGHTSKNLCSQRVNFFHRIHRRQDVSEDDAGISKHRLSPYNAYYHN